MRHLKKDLAPALLLVLLTGLIPCPLITVFAKAVIVDGRLDLYQAWQTIAGPENVRTVANSMLLGVCVVLCSTVIALPTAYLLARTQLSKHSWLDIIFMIPFMTPPYIASMGWIIFMQKKGLFQQPFPTTGSWSEGFFCFSGLVLVMSLHVFPFLMTMLKNAMLNIPASLEESGAVFGAGFMLRMRRIFALLLTGNYAIGVPYFSIISTSLIKLRGYGLAAGNFTLDHYKELLTTPKAIASIWKSLFLAVSSATICSVIGTAVVVAVRRSKGFFKKTLEGIGLLPEMLPSIVLVIGIMLFWNTIYKVIPLYNTIGIMVLAYVVLYLPYTVQYVTSAFTQINDSLLEAGRTFGGSPGYVFRRITLPMISRGIFAGWMMIFIIAFRELVTASLIAPPNTLVVSTYINREFEQGSVSLGMAMAVLCVLITTTALLIFNRLVGKRKGA